MANKKHTLLGVFYHKLSNLIFLSTLLRCPTMRSLVAWRIRRPLRLVVVYFTCSFPRNREKLTRFITPPLPQSQGFTEPIISRCIIHRMRSQGLQFTAATPLPNHSFTGTNPAKNANKKTTLLGGFFVGASSRTRTYDTAVNSRVLYRLSYKGKCIKAHMGCALTICVGITYLPGRPPTKYFRRRKA